MKNGSNWQYQRALAFDVEIASLKPIRAGSGDYASACYDNETSNYNEKNMKYLISKTNDGFTIPITRIRNVSYIVLLIFYCLD